MYLNFSIRNFFKDTRKYKSYFLFFKKLSKHKNIEIECITDTWYIFRFEFKIGYKEDHAGVSLSLSLLGTEIYFKFYDCRHWDYKNDCWEDYSAEEMIKNNFDGF